MKKIKVMSVFGTRPDAIKMAPLVLELKKRPEIEALCCVTAQHREMLDVVLEDFGIHADFDLNIMTSGQTLFDIATRAIGGLGEVFKQAEPDIVLVHGDTSTAFAGALAAFYSKIKVGHVEAGLRTFDKFSPFPEEMNRSLLGRISDLHFCPTRQNAENLKAEGVTSGVYVTGNTVIDAMKYTVKENWAFSTKHLKELDFKNRRVIVMTCHRRENYGQPMEEIFTAVRNLALSYTDVEVVYPVHPSPAVREAAGRILSDCPRVHLIDFVDTVEMHNLIARSYMVMTDSGGIQEEAPALGKPVLVLRRETERPEAVAAGTVALAGVEHEQIYALAAQLLDSPEHYRRMARAVNPYGDGNACPRIADGILWAFGLRDRPSAEFIP